MPFLQNAYACFGGNHLKVELTAIWYGEFKIHLRPTTTAVLEISLTSFTGPYLKEPTVKNMQWHWIIDDMMPFYDIWNKFEASIPDRRFENTVQHILRTIPNIFAVRRLTHLMRLVTNYSAF